MELNFPCARKPAGPVWKSFYVFGLLPGVENDTDSALEYHGTNIFWNMEKKKKKKKSDNAQLGAFQMDFLAFSSFKKENTKETFSLSVDFSLLSWRVFIFIKCDYLIQWKGW